MSAPEPLVNKLPLSKIFFVGFSLILLLKVFFAATLDLYSDEIYYWQASTIPSIAYSDLPFMTALLVRIGTSLDSYNPLAVRSIFILLGSSIPFLVYWLALPVTNKQQALESAFLALCLPLLGFLGLLAVPDVPLLFFGILSIGFFERSTRTNLMRFWLATGVVVAMGLSTHYRFFLYPISAILFLLLFKPARKYWSNPRLWICMIIASIGLIPILWFNISYDFDSAAFYFIDRHPWQFNAAGLLHIFIQAALSSPPMYLLFLLTIYLMVGKVRTQSLSTALLLSFSLTNLLIYLVLAPWADSDSTSIHWPLSGYIPLLVFMPEGLRYAYAIIQKSRSKKFAKELVFAIPAIGFCGTLAALIGIGSQAFQTPLRNILGDGVLSTKMAGWEQFVTHTDMLLDREFLDTNPIIVTDNYYTAAQLEFAGISNRVYTIDKSKAERDGRIRQYQIWGKHENGLIKQLNKPALFITEDSVLTIPEKHELIGEMCSYSDELAAVSQLDMFNGDKAFSYYSTNTISDPSDEARKATLPCPYPPRAWIDSPKPSESLSGKFIVQGWAFNEELGIESIQITLNGELVTSADYGLERIDVVSAMQVENEPNIPNLGFRAELDTASFKNGKYELELILVNSQGISTKYGKRSIEIKNP